MISGLNHLFLSKNSRNDGFLIEGMCWIHTPPFKRCNGSPPGWWNMFFSLGDFPELKPQKTTLAFPGCGVDPSDMGTMGLSHPLWNNMFFQTGCFNHHLQIRSQIRTPTSNQFHAVYIYIWFVWCAYIIIYLYIIYTHDSNLLHIESMLSVFICIFLQHPLRKHHQVEVRQSCWKTSTPDTLTSKKKWTFSPSSPRFKPFFSLVFTSSTPSRSSNFLPFNFLSFPNNKKGGHLATEKTYKQPEGARSLFWIHLFEGGWIKCKQL